jgi:uncharacterized protein
MLPSSTRKDESMRRLVTGSLLIVSFVSLAQPTPSFDCTKAGNETEKAICSNSDLAHIDTVINAQYKKLIDVYGIDKELRESQLRWIRKRNECGSNSYCIFRSITLRIEEIHNSYWIDDLEAIDNCKTVKPHVDEDGRAGAVSEFDDINGDGLKEILISDPWTARNTSFTLHVNTGSCHFLAGYFEGVQSLRISNELPSICAADESKINTKFPYIVTRSSGSCCDASEAFYQFTDTSYQMIPGCSIELDLTE